MTAPQARERLQTRRRKPHRPLVATARVKRLVGPSREASFTRARRRRPQVTSHAMLFDVEREAVVDLRERQIDRHRRQGQSAVQSLDFLVGPRAVDAA